MNKCTEQVYLLRCEFSVFIYCLSELKMHIMITKPIIYQTCIEFIQATIISPFYKTLFIMNTQTILIKQHELCLLKEYMFYRYKRCHTKN